MGLSEIFVLSALALALGWFAPRRQFSLLLLASSGAAIFWLQSSTPLRHLNFWLPAVSFGLTAMVWSTTLPSNSGARRRSLPGLGIAAA